MTGTVPSRRLQQIAGLYSLSWLLAANLVGLLLAILLVWPKLGHFLGPYGYGRWMPLHMDWQLYGWCSLPMVGFLMRIFFGSRSGSETDAHLGFAAWSIGLLVLGWMALHGSVSGKLFLNWSGASRIAFPAAQVFLWALLAGYSYRRFREQGRFDRLQWIQAGLLLALASTPVLLWVTADPAVYPPIDPESGGATGQSLLASTLGIIAIFGVLPGLMGIQAGPSARLSNRIYALSFVISTGVWLMIGHGNESNTQTGQILGLGVLVFWIPVVVFHYRSYLWSPGPRLWLKAFLAWWAFLTLTGFIEFLPGVLDHFKFTNALVGHAHLAMAGMISAFNMIVLGSLGSSGRGGPWADRFGFWIWNMGTLVYVLSMFLQGYREGENPFVNVGANTGTTVLYLIRLGAGLLLVVASVRWLILLYYEKNDA